MGRGEELGGPAVADDDVWVEFKAPEASTLLRKSREEAFEVGGLSGEEGERAPEASILERRSLDDAFVVGTLNEPPMNCRDEGVGGLVDEGERGSGRREEDEEGSKDGDD